MAAVLRFVSLDARPAHHDEAVNGMRIARTVQQGMYRYDPKNYHGPTLFYLGAATQVLFGDSLTLKRTTTVVFSLATLCLFFLVRRWIDPAVLLVALGLFATSPSLIYYARYFIHETIFVFFTVATFVLLWRASHSSRPRGWLIAAGVCGGACVATKETVVLNMAAAAVALLVIFPDARSTAFWRRWFRRGTVFALAAVVVATVFFTGFFMDPGGVARLASSVFLWGIRGMEGEGHDKSPLYFAMLLLRTDPAILLAGFIGLGLALRARNQLIAFFGVWAACLFALYSAIPYKTPWSIITVVALLVLPAAYTLTRLPRKVCLAVVPAVIALSAAQAFTWSTLTYDTANNPLAYVQTHRELRELVEEILQHATPNTRVRSFYKTRWPLPWYFRRASLDTSERDTVPIEPDADVLFMSRDQERGVRLHMKRSYVRREAQFREGAVVVAYIREDWPIRGAQHVAPIPQRFTPPSADGRSPSGLLRVFSGRLPIGEPVVVTNADLVQYNHRNDDFKPYRAPAFLEWDGWIQAPNDSPLSLRLRTNLAGMLWLNGDLVLERAQTGGATTTEIPPLKSGQRSHVRLHAVDTGGGTVMALEMRSKQDTEWIQAPVFGRSVFDSRN